MSTVASRKLTLDDIADVRAYERERPALRAAIGELKRRRRVALGPFVSVLFENRETMRYQVQEMARVERLSTDAEILAEIAAYNPMIPEPGELCATLMIELTSEEQMLEWLPALVGIEHSLVLRCAGGHVVRAAPEETHASQLTRAGVTPAVHFLQFRLSAEEIADLASGPVVLALDHPRYSEEARLPEATVGELLTDLR